MADGHAKVWWCWKKCNVCDVMLCCGQSICYVHVPLSLCMTIIHRICYLKTALTLCQDFCSWQRAFLRTFAWVKQVLYVITNLVLTSGHQRSKPIASGRISPSYNGLHHRTLGLNQTLGSNQTLRFYQCAYIFWSLFLFFSIHIM